MFGRKHIKPIPIFAVVMAEKNKDGIAYSVTMEHNQEVAVRSAEALAGDRYGTVAVAVIDWTGCQRWNQGRRIAYFGEVEI